MSEIDKNEVYDDPVDAYADVISGLVRSGYNGRKIAIAVEHLSRHPLAKLRCSLLRRGYSPEDAEKLFAQGRYHHLME